MLARIKKYFAEKKSRKEYLRNKKKMVEALRALVFIDYWHNRLGVSRRDRKLFWARFIREPEFREQEIEKFLKLLSQGGKNGF